MLTRLYKTIHMGQFLQATVDALLSIDDDLTVQLPNVCTTIRCNSEDDSIVFADVTPDDDLRKPPVARKLLEIAQEFMLDDKPFTAKLTETAADLSILKQLSCSDDLHDMIDRLSSKSTVADSVKITGMENLVNFALALQKAIKEKYKNKIFRKVEIFNQNDTAQVVKPLTTSQLHGLFADRNRSLAKKHPSWASKYRLLTASKQADSDATHNSNSIHNARPAKDL